MDATVIQSTGETLSKELQYSVNRTKTNYKQDTVILQLQDHSNFILSFTIYGELIFKWQLLLSSDSPKCVGEQFTQNAMQFFKILTLPFLILLHDHSLNQVAS